MKKHVVYVTYGVYVDAEEAASEETIIEMAVQKMFAHGEREVASACSAEVEDVTEEFAEVV